jgi:hypothetical protein
MPVMQGEFVSLLVENAAEPRRNPGHALTGVVSWASIAVAVLGCFFFPRVWMAIATVFLVYFIVRMLVTTVFALVGQRKIQEWELRDWTAGEDAVGEFGFAPSDVHHVVIVPTYKEPAEIINRTLDALAAQHRADERLIVVLGMEEREADARTKSDAIIRRYAGRFLHMMATIHPGNLPGEEPGKSSNEAWAGRRARAEIDRLGIDPALTTITSCDADSVLHRSYFSAVASSFAQEERRHLSFWQAPIFFYNNIWQVPAPIRFTTWMQHASQLSELAMPWFDSLPISTYTLSLELCERCGYWDPAVIPEDWHAYLKCLFETGDEIAVHSVFLPTFGDATDGDGMVDAVKNRFEQLKRHSWGAEDVGYIWGELTERKHAWRSSTIFRFTQVLHDHSMRVINWAVLTSIYLYTAYFSRLHWYDLGWRSSIAQDIVILNVLFVTGTMIMLTSILLELWRCPPPDSKSRLGTAVEIMTLWLLLPILGLLLGMLPALSAQTRLMLSIPLGYKVTPKRFTEPVAQKAA